MVALRRHHVLRAADRLADADPGGPRRAGRCRCARSLGAGEPLNPEVIEQVRRALGPHHARRLRPDRDDRADRQHAGPAGQAGLDGPAAARLRVALLDPISGEPADEGEIASTSTRRPLGLMAGYRDAGGAHGRRDGGGYYHTGDVAARDADGYITYVGRTDDVFKASDYRICPFELESVLIEHEAVAEAAVVPSPDPMRLAVPKAYVSLAAGPRADARRRRSRSCASRASSLAPYKRIRRLEFAELPKTISGKIRRVELREDEHARTQRSPNEFWEEDFPELKRE